MPSAGSSSIRTGRAAASSDLVTRRDVGATRALLAILFFFASSPCAAEENASNPLAKVKNTDVRLQYFDNTDGSGRWDFWAVDGAFMATDKLKIKYEIHYWKTDITGSSEHDLSSVHIKPIYFPKQGTLGSWEYSLAVGGGISCRREGSERPRH